MTSEALAEYSQAVLRELGDELKKARIERSLTQEQVSELVGISRASVANIERGEQGVSIPLFLRLASAFKIDGGKLLGGLRMAEVGEPVEIPDKLPAQVKPGELNWVASVLAPREE